MVTTRAKVKETENTLKTLIASNDDLLIEILRRLPAKSIIQFKSVSKHWRSLLSQRHFTLMFDNLLITRGLLFIIFIFRLMLKTKTLLLFVDLIFTLIFVVLESCSLVMDYYFVVVMEGTIYFIGLAFHHKDCVNYKVV